MINQSQAVLVFVRCFRDKELEAVKMHSAVLNEVYEVKAKHCPATKAIEFIIVDTQLNEHGSLAEFTQKVAMKELVSAINSGSLYVQDTSFQHHLINKNLLCFEPYAGIGNKLLTSIFDTDEANETFSEEILSSISVLQAEAGAQTRHTEYIIQLVNRFNKPIVYQNLRDLFDMYSLFHGIDPTHWVSYTSYHIHDQNTCKHYNAHYILYMQDSPC